MRSAPPSRGARAGDDFLICPQNGVSILDDRDCRLEMLARFDEAGIPIFVIEYIGPGKRDAFFRKLEDSGLAAIGYPAHPDRELDELIEVE